MARRKSPAFDDQRRLILSRAAELFAQRGYSATSMNDLAEACRLSKPTLYHYYADKDDLLLSIVDRHVSALVELVDVVESEFPPGPLRLQALITRFLDEYADAQNEHRVLTEDVRFLATKERKRILDKERRVVVVFANAIAAVRPELASAGLTKPLAMLLFGMLNWLFTWLRPDGALTHASIAPLVNDLFLGGLAAVRVKPAPAPGVRNANHSRRARVGSVPNTAR